MVQEYLHKEEVMSRDELTQLQLQRLKHTIRQAKKGLFFTGIA